MSENRKIEIKPKKNLPRKKIAGRDKFISRNFSGFCVSFLTIILFSLSNIYAERLPVKTYTIADGLLRDLVYKIKQDSRGFLWFCTAEGVSRFDGYGFTNFTVADGLPDGNVNDFLDAGDGAIYLATDGGLAKMNPKGARGAAGEKQSAALFTVIKPDNPQAKNTQTLYKDADGAVWIGTSNGLYRLNRADELAAVDLGELKTDAKKISVTAIVKDRRGALWIGTHGSGLFRLAADGKVSQFTTADGMPGNIIASLFEDRDGNFWAGMRWDDAKAGLARLNAEADGTKENPIVARSFTIADGLPANWIPSMLQTGDGKFWLATVGGLCEWQGENAKSVCKIYRAKNDLCDKDVWSLAEDREGNLWTGSWCGAKKIARYGFTAYGAADGIESMQANTIFENRKGELFASINTDGTRMIYRFGENKFVAVKPDLPADFGSPGWGLKQTVQQISTDAWLVPTGNGLYEFSSETTFENLDKTMPRKISPATRGAEIFRVFEDSRGDLWLGTTSGARELWRWERAANVWHDYTAQLADAPQRLVTSFAEDQSGNVWIGTGGDSSTLRGELLRWHDGEFRIFDEADNLPVGWIRDLYVDRAGRLWLANTRNGLLRIDDVNAPQLNFTRYSNADGLSSAGAYCVTEDAYGRIYVGSARGLDRLDPATGQIENFTTADGLPSSYVEIAYRDRQNNLWFGTANGLTRYVPEPERRRIAPATLITALRVNGEAQSVSILGETDIPKIELDSEQKQVSVDFIGLGASLGEPLKYEYRLGDADWTRTNERTVNFANLSSGNYKFEVRAVTADRIYSQPATLSFRIAAPVYLRWWFIVLAVGLTALTVFAVYRYRLNKLLEIERTRTRIATDLHDDIGTNLSKISLLSEIVNLQLAEQNNESRNLLNSIAEISRESVTSMSDIVWAINPKRDSFSELVRRMRLYVEEIFIDRQVRVTFNAPGYAEDSIKLSMNARRELYLIYKEAVSNAARHSNCSHIKIDVRLENNIIFLQITDDGRGFDISKKSDGNGLENMRSRAEKNAGSFEIESAPNRGTILKISFPQK